jgi:hypothetical protein
MEVSSHPRRFRGVGMAISSSKGAANTHAARRSRWEFGGRRSVGTPRPGSVSLMADTTPSPGGKRQATRRTQRSDPPGFTFEIRYLDGAEGERLETVQLEAIREVLQWLHKTHTRPTQTPPPAR